MTIDDYLIPGSARRRVGDKVSFIPSCFSHMQRDDIPLTLHGSVIYVNEPHRYYVVAAPCNDYTIREAFKF